MELLKLSRFKLKLQALITEVHELREKERFSSDQLQFLVQKQNQTEDEFSRKLTDLEVELASSNELRQKFERKVRYLEDDNSMLESKQKELKGTISSLLQSKESFVKVYENSTSEMKRSIESRDRKIAILSEKINAHLLSFDSIQKEASSVKQVVDNAQSVLSEKEEVVARLKMKVDEVSTFEKSFVEKISDLENKLRSNDDELRKKDMIIAELKTQLEMAKLRDQCQSKIEELQETLLAKEGIIQNLISENKALRYELGRLEITIKKIQDTVMHMNEENRVTFSSMLVNQENALVREIEDDRINAEVQNSTANSHHKASGRRVAETTASPLCEEYNSISNLLRDNKNFESCVSQSACFPPNSACSESQLAVNILADSGAEAKDNCTTLVQQLDS